MLASWKPSEVAHDHACFTLALADTNGDGYDDLILTFRRADMHLSTRATRVRLIGWLANSQVFVADAALR